MNKIKEFFNNVAPSWNNTDNNFEVVDKLVNLLDIRENDKVLDVACGKGFLTPKLYQKSLTKVKAIDLSDKMIDDAKKINNDVSKYEFICGDFLEYEFDTLFDYVVIFNAYPHFLDVESLNEKCAKVLKKGGMLAIMHDISYEELNGHHKAKAMGVSRYISSSKEEANKFLNNFVLVNNFDDNNSYFILLKRI